MATSFYYTLTDGLGDESVFTAGSSALSNQKITLTVNTPPSADEETVALKAAANRGAGTYSVDIDLSDNSISADASITAVGGTSVAGGRQRFCCVRERRYLYQFRSVPPHSHSTVRR